MAGPGDAWCGPGVPPRRIWEWEAWVQLDRPGNRQQVASIVGSRAPSQQGVETRRVCNLPAHILPSLPHWQAPQAQAGNMGPFLGLQVTRLDAGPLTDGSANGCSGLSGLLPVSQELEKADFTTNFTDKKTEATIG